MKNMNDHQGNCCNCPYNFKNNFLFEWEKKISIKNLKIHLYEKVETITFAKYVTRLFLE